MAHRFLSIDMREIPQSTKNNVPTFWGGLFSNDLSRMLIDGYNADGVMVHPDSVLLAWTRWSDNPQEVINSILSSAIEYTKDEYLALKADSSSIWYVAGDDL